MNNKKAKGWILCPSKSFPGHFYYFNLSTGAVHWSLSDDQKNLIKKDIQKADAFHSYPEPNSPLENTNISKNILIEKEEHNSKNPQALFVQTSFPQYISNVHLTPKGPTVQKTPYYSELPTFGTVTFPKYISVPRLESDVKNEMYKQSTQSRYKLNSSKMTNTFDIKHDRICKTNVYNKRKNMKNLLKEPVLKKNIIENYFLLSNSNQIQSNSMYRNPFALKQFKNNYRSNHLPIKENNFTVSKSVGTQTSFSNGIAENNLQYTLKSRELHKNKQNHNFFQNNRSSSPSVQSLSSLEPEIYSPLRTDQSNTLIMKKMDGSEHTFQLNGSDNYQNIPMDIEKNDLSQINIIANDDIPTNTNHSIVRSPESYEMPVSNENGQNNTPDNYLRTFRECNRKSHENVFYFGNEINMLPKDTFEGENEINAAIKNKIHIREETDQDRRPNENNTTYNKSLEVQDLIGKAQHDTSVHSYNGMHVEHPQYKNNQNIFKKDKRGKTRDALCMETLAGNDLRYVLEAKQQAKKIETVSNKAVDNKKKHVTFALNENSIIENGNYCKKNVLNSHNSFTIKDLEAIQIEIKNNITEDENILNDTSDYEADELKNKIHYVSSCPPKIETSKKNHIDNGTLRMRIDRNETNQSRFVNDQILPNLNNSNYEISNYEDEYQRFLNSRGNVSKKMEFIIPNSNFEFGNEHRVYNIEDSLKRFDVDCEEIEHRVILRVDEWVCCFTQIMEEFLEDVVKQSFIRLDPPPPWSFDEILTCTKTIYEENTKIVTIVDRIIALFREIQFRDRNSTKLQHRSVSKNIEPTTMHLRSEYRNSCVIGDRQP